MREIAAFASSDAGQAFARIEQHYGRDPAASLEEVDDVLAHNLRTAFLVTLSPEPEEVDEHTAAIEKLRAHG